MGICPNCGSWVDDGDICMNCGGSGSYSSGNDDDSYESHVNRRYLKRDNYSKRAWEYYMEFQEEEALYNINEALNLDSRHAGNWNRKAIILEAMKRYAESEECYNKSLSLARKDIVCDNKARMLYDWAAQLLEDSKNLPDGTAMLKNANRTLQRAITSLPGEKSEENIEKYFKLRDSINFYIDYEAKYRRDLSELDKYDKSELFTITGRRFYLNNINLNPGMPLRLVRETDNEFDSDAIAVYAGDEKIGYVANSANTKYAGSSSASELKNSFLDNCEARYLLYLQRYAKIQFSIGRIVKKS